MPCADRRIRQADAGDPGVLAAESLQECDVVEEAPHRMHEDESSQYAAPQLGIGSAKVPLAMASSSA